MAPSLSVTVNVMAAQAAATVMAGQDSLPIAAEPYRTQRKDTLRQNLRLCHEVGCFVATWVHLATKSVSLSQGKLLCRKVSFPVARSTPLSQGELTLSQSELLGRKVDSFVAK
jgi:hypothetical protein